MALDIEKMRHDMKMEDRKLMVQVIAGAIAAIGTGIGMAWLIWGH
ncbi:MAG: hypothetical protein ACJ8AI_08325 [Rhodopila sp.]